MISIDACVREPSGLIVGVTLVKTNSEQKEVYFNLYGVHCDPTAPFSWDKIAGASTHMQCVCYTKSIMSWVIRYLATQI